MKRMKKFAALLLVVAMTFGMVACSSSDKKEESTKKETKTEEKSTKKLDGTLKVVTTGDAYQPLFDKFTEEVGPKVEFISMSSGEVLSKLKAEGGTPAADLWFGGGIDAFMKNEVLTYAPDAWVDEKKTQIGYEISFTKYFYKPVELRDMSDILSSLSTLEQEADGLLAGIMEGVQ